MKAAVKHMINILFLYLKFSIKYVSVFSLQKTESRNSRGSIDREDGSLQAPVSRCMHVCEHFVDTNIQSRFTGELVWWVSCKDFLIGEKSAQIKERCREIWQMLAVPIKARLQERYQRKTLLQKATRKGTREAERSVQPNWQTEGRITEPGEGEKVFLSVCQGGYCLHTNHMTTDGSWEL